MTVVKHRLQEAADFHDPGARPLPEQACTSAPDHGSAHSPGHPSSTEPATPRQHSRHFSPAVMMSEPVIMPASSPTAVLRGEDGSPDFRCSHPSQLSPHQSQRHRDGFQQSGQAELEVSHILQNQSPPQHLLHSPQRHTAVQSTFHSPSCPALGLSDSHFPLSTSTAQVQDQSFPQTYVQQQQQQQHDLHPSSGNPWAPKAQSAANGHSPWAFGNSSILTPSMPSSALDAWAPTGLSTCR